MADSPTCPECGGRLVVTPDGKGFCQGKTDATDEVVAAADGARKRALARGENVLEADDAWRSLANQRSCGKISLRDSSGVFRMTGFRDQGASF